MLASAAIAPLDYLVIGHLTRDITPDGFRMGGTAAYSGLTAHALGMRTGVLTAWAGELTEEKLKLLHILNKPAQQCTTFENRYTDGARVQKLLAIAPPIEFTDIPPQWRNTAIIHIGPVAGEISAVPDGLLSPGLLGLTPQGWLRTWDDTGRVTSCQWEEAPRALANAGAAVISVEDVGGDEDEIERMVSFSKVLAVTEGPAGARLFWNGDLRRFRAPRVKEVDATGSGDIFAAAFFIRLSATRNPWEAARFATQLASISVTRPGLEGIPTADEIKNCLVEVL